VRIVLADWSLSRCTVADMSPDSATTSLPAVAPGNSVMYGAHEEELMRSAAFWAGKTTRSQQSYDHNLDGKTTSRQFGNALEPEELSPRNIGQARLLVRGTPGQMVELIEWTDFVRYLDELRGGRADRRKSAAAAE
jgi:hypothetical protein